MQAALGIEYGGRHATFLLPDPLLPGESPRTDENGVRLWNPNWKLDANAPEIQQFNAHVKRSLEDDEQGLDEKDVSVVLVLTSEYQSLTLTLFPESVHKAGGSRKAEGGEDLLWPLEEEVQRADRGERKSEGRRAGTEERTSST